MLYAEALNEILNETHGIGDMNTIYSGGKGLFFNYYLC